MWSFINGVKAIFYSVFLYLFSTDITIYRLLLVPTGALKINHTFALSDELT